MEGNVNWIPLGILGIDRGDLGNQISHGHPPQAKAEEGLGWSAFLRKKDTEESLIDSPDLSS